RSSRRRTPCLPLSTRRPPRQTFRCPGRSTRSQALPAAIALPSETLRVTWEGIENGSAAWRACEHAAVAGDSPPLRSLTGAGARRPRWPARAPESGGVDLHAGVDVGDHREDREAREAVDLEDERHRVRHLVVEAAAHAREVRPPTHGVLEVGQLVVGIKNEAE